MVSLSPLKCSSPVTTLVDVDLAVAKMMESEIPQPLTVCFMAWLISPAKIATAFSRGTTRVVDVMKVKSSLK